MIRLFPVEAAAVDQKDLLIPEQIKGKLFVVCDIEPFYIDLREDVESGFWFYGADTGDIGQCLVNIISLFADASARFDIAAHALMPPSAVWTMDCAGTLEQRRILESILSPSM